MVQTPRILAYRSVSEVNSLRILIILLMLSVCVCFFKITYGPMFINMSCRCSTECARGRGGGGTGREGWGV